MFKEILSKLSTRLLYIIFAVIVSIALWLYVEITENELQIDTVSRIEIVFKNEDLLRDRGFLITSHSPEQMSITFEASRTDMAKLAAPGALTVEVDLGNISSTGPTELVYEIIYPSNVNSNSVTLLTPATSRITLMVDRILDRQLPVKVNYTGGLASEELIQESVEFDPQTITVWGPESLVTKISYVRVPILREFLSTTFREELEFVLVDENDEILELEPNQLELLEFSHHLIHVTVPIMEMKDVPLTVILAHGAGTSEVNTTVRIEPEFVKVAGDPVALRDLNNIFLGTIDMLGFSRVSTEAFWIIIPNNLTNISGETEAIAHVEVIGLEIAFHSTSNLQVINTPPGFRAEILTQSLDVRLRGSADDLSTISSLNLRVVADISNMNQGTARIPARVYIDGTDAPVDPVGVYEITVSIIAE